MVEASRERSETGTPFAVNAERGPPEAASTAFPALEGDMTAQMPLRALPLRFRDAARPDAPPDRATREARVRSGRTAQPLVVVSRAGRPDCTHAWRFLAASPRSWRRGRSMSRSSPSRAGSACWGVASYWRSSASTSGARSPRHGGCVSADDVRVGTHGCALRSAALPVPLRGRARGARGTPLRRAGDARADRRVARCSRNSCSARCFPIPRGARRHEVGVRGERASSSGVARGERGAFSAINRSPYHYADSCGRASCRRATMRVAAAHRVLEQRDLPERPAALGRRGWRAAPPCHQYRGDRWTGGAFGPEGLGWSTSSSSAALPAALAAREITAAARAAWTPCRRDVRAARDRAPGGVSAVIVATVPHRPRQRPAGRASPSGRPITGCSVRVEHVERRTRRGAEREGKRGQPRAWSRAAAIEHELRGHVPFRHREHWVPRRPDEVGAVVAIEEVQRAKHGEVVP